jgi:uncharacterized membrane protein (UPF0127 family)
MDAKLLTTPGQRARGAMFRNRLGETVLLFCYPNPAPRLFHTFFCPPLRIVALNDSGLILFDQVRPPGQLIRLPTSRLIIEADPVQELPPARMWELAKRARVARKAAG